jgi:flagellar biosynthesis repressor protein FlbT
MGLLISAIKLPKLWYLHKMALKITLKPHEKVIIGGAVINNGSSACHLTIENSVPILRQADILAEQDANSPCKRIYLTIQLMYIDEQRSAEYHPIYWDLVKDVVQAAPSMKELIVQISEMILAGKLYQALKLAKNLISYEQELIQNAIKPS